MTPNKVFSYERVNAYQTHLLKTGRPQKQANKKPMWARLGGVHI